MSAKIAAVVPVGYLDRMGYQHVWKTCYRNIRTSVDGVAVVDSVWHRGQQKQFLKKHWVAHSRLFARKPNGSYWFDAYGVMENVNRGIDHVMVEGYDAAIVLMCNNYLGDPARLYEAAEQMLAADLPYTYYYRYDQLADQMFGPSVRLPWLVNLHHKADVRFSVDCLVVNGEVIGMERRQFPDWAPHIVDVQLEMTREDLAEKMNFIRCYSDLVPKRNPVFDWGYWFPYYVDKFKKKQRRPDLELTKTGKAIAANSRPDFVSHEVLKCLG